MNNDIILIENKKVERKAFNHFYNMCGFNNKKDKYKVMLKEALLVKEKILNSIILKAVVSSYEKDSIKGNRFTLNNYSIQCNILEQIDIKSIKKIYAYILTAGEIDTSGFSMMEAFYADTWMTAYIDGAREFLKDYLLKDNIQKYSKAFISNSLDPGTYGIDTKEVKKLCDILDCGKIGIKVNEAGFMNPVKSCTGLFLIIDDIKQLPGKECISCYGNKKGCHFCIVKNR